MRIGVNIPNDLYRRMEPFKHTINISQLCREAIETYVEDYERARDRLEADHLDEAVERLSSEDELLEVDWEELGWTDAKEWVDGASKEYFDHIFHKVDVLKRQGRPVWVAAEYPLHVEGANDFHQRVGEHNKYFEHTITLNPEADPHKDAQEEYHRAWLAYLCAVREKIRQLREERFRAKSKSPIVRAEPEVPDQLKP